MGESISAGLSFSEKSTSGETILGETILGETIFGETILGETILDETIFGETISGEAHWWGNSPVGESISASPPFSGKLISGETYW